jgi:hypothetical protein
MKFVILIAKRVLRYFIQEIAKKELENLDEQRLSLENEIESLAEQSTVLHTLYARQDELLKK